MGTDTRTTLPHEGEGEWKIGLLLNGESSNRNSMQKGRIQKKEKGKEQQEIRNQKTCLASSRLFLLFEATWNRFGVKHILLLSVLLAAFTHRDPATGVILFRPRWAFP